METFNIDTRNATIIDKFNCYMLILHSGVQIVECWDKFLYKELLHPSLSWIPHTKNTSQKEPYPSWDTSFKRLDTTNSERKIREN